MPAGRMDGMINETSSPDKGQQGQTFQQDLTVTELFATYEPALRTYTLGLVQDYDLADDLVQEAFIKAMGNLNLLTSLNPYQRRSWLYKVVKNQFLDDRRSRIRRQALLAQMAVDTQADFALTAIVAQVRLSEHIPEHYRSLLEKRYILGMSSLEIAQELHIPDATVRSRLRFAVNWLRTHQDEIF